ncbi:MAG: nucleotidyltransferase domain-containing protein [Chloroflexota bacterium]|nr:nucleotidyltransferase domain-containing protein [Chloroflexota bacterium]
MDAIFARLGVTGQQIEAFCRKWDIVRFELFGSVLRDDFGPASDVDVLVTFAEGRGVRLSDLLDMEDELQALFRRPVDLIKRHLVETSPNWVRRQSILGSAREVYAAAS